MTARNDITGDKIQTSVPSKEYKDNWDRIFGKTKEENEKKYLEDKEVPLSEVKDDGE